MNIWKLAAGLAPAIALLASTSAAQQQLCPSGDGCPVTATCPQTPDTISTIHSTTIGDDDYTDSYGPAVAPFPPFPLPRQLSVKQFNPAVIALGHPGVDASQITLLSAQVKTSANLSGNVFFNNKNPSTGCTVTWNFDVNVDLAQNDDVGTPALNIMLQAGGQAPLSPGQPDCPAQAQYEFQDSFGPITDSACVCESVDLDPWTGSGNIEWDLFTSAVDSDVSPCGAICKIYENLTEVKIEVVYTYCVTVPRGGGDPPGCECDGPSPHYREPGSLLLYPEFDNREGDFTLLTITNADCTGDDVDVEFMFIDAEDCSEFNTTITLTPCDTFTALTNVVNPNMQQGYFYAFAKDDQGNAITHNGLIGSAMVISGIEQFDYSVNPVSFQGMTAEGSPTDLDDDGIRDLDGAEYDKAPDTITIPRFLGQGLDSQGEGASIDSHLILIALSGGQDFTTTICFDVYNDNEEGFSGEYTFYCWEKPTLLDVRGSFANEFLLSTDHDPNEILGAANRRESGWICIDGCFADSLQETIADPAFYAVLVERVSNYTAADLPFECGMQDNGALLPRGLFGDGDPIPVNGDNQ